MTTKATIELSQREAAFVAALARGEPQTTAARSAGMSIGSAAPMLRRPGVQAAVRDAAARLNRALAWAAKDASRRRTADASTTQH